MTVEPVRKQIVVATTREHAFAVFTGALERWWPKDHHIGKSPLAKYIIEGREGGRWYAICQDGSECDSGKVLAWEPPGRLILAWQINADWQYDPSLITEVEVTFTTEGPKQTRVALEHRNLERFGARAADVRKSIDDKMGWGHILDEYAKAAAL